MRNPALLAMASVFSSRVSGHLSLVCLARTSPRCQAAFLRLNSSRGLGLARRGSIQPSLSFCTTGPPSLHDTHAASLVRRARYPRADYLLMAAIFDGPVDKIIDGKKIAEEIREDLKGRVAELKASKGITPGLAVVLVGGRTDSATYVRMKCRACDEIGMASFRSDYPADVSEEELLAKIDELNKDSKVHGILIQLPLPEHIHEQKVLDSVLPEKDVDGLHPLNLAQLAHTNTHGSFRQFDLNTLPFHAACTPQGCIELIERSGVTIEGKEAVVIGRSNIVGIPVSLLLLQKNATVTLVHSRTKDPASVVKRADIVVAAVGKAELVKADWIKPGAIVIDVGINSVDDPDSTKGYKLVGDVDFQGVRQVAGKITPVPGGVGPMTIAMLLRNTVNGAARIGA